MPHDVTMPQLGMAQNSGKIVSWLKQAGDQVAKGDTLFEVETDKATMEVEAQADGFLTGVVANAGDDVPVGQVIARISDSADDDAPKKMPEVPEATPENDGALPEGKAITMPQLGMAQDSGLLVNWQKSPGDRVAADDVLFEVETDKSTMEVPAGADGYLAATLAEAGETIPVGSAVAIISDTPPEHPVARKFTQSDTVPAAVTPAVIGEKAEKKPVAPPRGSAQLTPVIKPGDRILASPKARRLAKERGLDLGRLAQTGHPQPYHVADLDVLAKMPAAETVAPANTLRLVAEIDCEGLTDFVLWAAEACGLQDSNALLAGLAGACLPEADRAIVAVECFGTRRVYAVPAGRLLSRVEASEDDPQLLLRDLRGTRLRTVETGAADIPALTLTNSGAGLTVALECTPAQLGAQDAIALLAEFAGRLEEPLRHLL